MIDQYAARLAIERVHILYTYLIDDQRLEEWGELFCEDASWTLGRRHHFVGRKNIVNGIAQLQPERPGMVRHITYPPVLEFEGDEVISWADTIALIVREEASPIVTVGRFYDTMRRSDGRWRFAKRLFMPSGEPLPPGVRPCPAY